MMSSPQSAKRKGMNGAEDDLHNSRGVLHDENMALLGKIYNHHSRGY